MFRLSKQLIFSILISNEPIRKSDAIVVLEGDYFVRVYRTVELFRNGLGKYIVISGGIDDPKTGRIHSFKLAQKIISLGIPRNNVIIEDISLNTRAQAMEILRLAKERGWKKIILVASHFHQFRAFLTFLKAMKEMRCKIQIFNVPARNISWFKKDKNTGLSRLQLLQKEFNKIEKYKKHVVSFKEAIKYQRWKDRQK